MNTPLAYLNGRFLPFTEAALPLHDAGFVSGATIVDNARTFRHTLFRWPDHLARFRRDCAACYVPLDASDESLIATAEELVAHNAKLLPPGGELQLVTFATPGPLGFYLGEATSGPATLGMVTYPLPFARYRRFFTEGVTLAIAGMQHSHSQDLLPPRVKHRSRLFWHIAAHVLKDPASELSWRLDPPATDASVVPVVFGGAGAAADTAIGSILVVLGDTVVAQDEGHVQDSISARVVRELCAAVGLKSHAGTIELGRFARPPLPEEERSKYPQPSELLLAGTGFCVAGVRRFGFRDRCRDYAWPGPVFGMLLAAWSDLVGVDVAKQFIGEGV
ncbi:MAG: aminotransferase class IV [Planctomycetes bacterium]|nr:aminotransferase class IV [Planctomycetota bacterium]